MADERESLWKRVNESKVLTVDEKRDALGYETYTPGSGLGAKIYGPLNESPLSETPKEDGNDEKGGNLEEPGDDTE